MATSKAFTSVRTMPDGQMMPAKELFDIYFPIYLRQDCQKDNVSFLEWFNSEIAYEDYCKHHDI